MTLVDGGSLSLVVIENGDPQRAEEAKGTDRAVSLEVCLGPGTARHVRGAHSIRWCRCRTSSWRRRTGSRFGSVLRLRHG